MAAGMASTGQDLRNRAGNFLSVMHCLALYFQKLFQRNKLIVTAINFSFECRVKDISVEYLKRNSCSTVYISA